MTPLLARTVLRATAAPLAVFALYLLLGRATAAYVEHPWLDIPTHFVGGVAICHCFYTLVTHGTSTGAALPLWARMLMALGLSALAAIGWEFTEFARDVMLGIRLSTGTLDLLGDLFFGLAGACLMLGWLLGRARARECRS